MRKPLYLGVTFLFLSMLCAQRSYNSVDEIKSEWGDYTSYQRDELISFCDFLFKEKHYERCLLSSFQFLFKFPEDPVRPAILYIIARSYEELKNYSLSRRYYNQLIKLENNNSVAYKAATRRAFTQTYYLVIIRLFLKKLPRQMIHICSPFAVMHL